MTDQPDEFEVPDNEEQVTEVPTDLPPSYEGEPADPDGDQGLDPEVVIDNAGDGIGP